MSSDGRFTHCFFAVCLWLCFASHRASPVCLPCYCVCNNSQSVALPLFLSHLCSLVPAMLSLTVRSLLCSVYLSISLCALSLIVAYHLWCVLAERGRAAVRGREEDRARTSLGFTCTIAFYFIDPEQKVFHSHFVVVFSVLVSTFYAYQAHLCQAQLLRTIS